MSFQLVASIVALVLMLVGLALMFAGTSDIQAKIERGERPPWRSLAWSVLLVQYGTGLALVAFGSWGTAVALFLAGPLFFAMIRFQHQIHR